MNADDLAQLAHVDELPAIPCENPLELEPGEVDLWLCFYTPLTDADLLRAWQRLMTPEEAERHARYRFGRHRHQFLATRALCRWVLSRYAPVAPEAWRFETGPHGKPHIASPATPLWFNLSNTEGLAVCAVGTSERIGVDVEAIDRRTEPLAIADRFFAPSEVAALRRLPPERHRQRFFSYWTLKESYIKAIGTGLATPLADFAFELDRGPGIGISFAPHHDDDPTRWRFALLRASDDHFLAVGAGDGHPLHLRAARCVPLVGIVSA